MWPAARYAGGFVGEPADSDFESRENKGESWIYWLINLCAEREAFPALFMSNQQIKRAAVPEWSLDVPVVALAGAKERRAPFSAEEDRWMKAMDNLRKPRYSSSSRN